jgi:hypothetical protein
MALPPLYGAINPTLAKKTFNVSDFVRTMKRLDLLE